jgi:small-conductance mechanosensitive channel
MSFFENFYVEVIATLVLLMVVITLRYLVAKAVKSYSKSHSGFENRTNLIIKYIFILINLLAFVAILIIWGVQRKDILFTLSSIATVVGVAMFAQWSILSNITSGVILFFFYPFKIGDIIKIHDKDFPVQGEIKDISAFHVSMKTIDGEFITYPNNLLLQKGISIIKNNFEDTDFVD